MTLDGHTMRMQPPRLDAPEGEADAVRLVGRELRLKHAPRVLARQRVPVVHRVRDQTHHTTHQI